MLDLLHQKVIISKQQKRETRKGITASCSATTRMGGEKTSHGCFELNPCSSRERSTDRQAVKRGIERANLWRKSDDSSSWEEPDFACSRSAQRKCHSNRRAQCKNGMTEKAIPYSTIHTTCKKPHTTWHYVHTMFYTHNGLLKSITAVKICRADDRSLVSTMFFQTWCSWYSWTMECCNTMVEKWIWQVLHQFNAESVFNDTVLHNMWRAVLFDDLQYQLSSFFSCREYMVCLNSFCICSRTRYMRENLLEIVVGLLELKTSRNSGDHGHDVDKNVPSWCRGTWNAF